MNITVGICAYNEEKNIGKLLESLLNQNVDHYIKKIIVVSSACTDNTNDIVKHYMDIDKRICIITQDEREGKASAINVILKNAGCDIIVLASADILLVENTIKELVSPYIDNTIGMTGGRPIPKNGNSNFLGYLVHLLWELHHHLAIKSPKLGEIVSFRNIIGEIPVDTAVDEAIIECMIKKKGYKLCYAPEAIVYNKGPTTIKDLLKQRRRIFAGHIHLKKTYGYSPSSMPIFNIIKIFRNISIDFKIHFLIGAIFIELYSRALGTYDFYIIKKNHSIWDIAETTKDVDEQYNTIYVDEKIIQIDEQ